MGPIPVDSEALLLMPHVLAPLAYTQCSSFVLLSHLISRYDTNFCEDVIQWVKNLPFDAHGPD